MTDAERIANLERALVDEKELNTPLREERDALRSLLSRVERLTGVGPPSRPGKPTPGSTWYDLLVQVNALVRGSRERAISPESQPGPAPAVDGMTSDNTSIRKLGACGCDWLCSRCGPGCVTGTAERHHHEHLKDCPAGGPEQDRRAAAIRPAGTTERCVGFEPHPWAIYAEEYCVAPVYGEDGRPHYCGRPRREHQEQKP